VRTKINTINSQRYALVMSLLLIISSTISRGQSETYTWGNVAMGGGGFVSGIITSKTEQNLMYARTDVGGAYRWDAANKRWIPLLDWVNESQVGYLGVESIAIDPVSTNKVYMLVGTSYFNSGATAILRSSDYGNTFSVVNVTSQFKAHGNGMGRQTGEKLVVDPNKTDILFCGTRADGLFKSTDAGVTWNKVAALNVTTTTNGNGISFVIMDASTGSAGNATQTIIVGISRSGTTNMYRSDDGGATFNAIANAPTTLMPHRAVLASDKDLYITYANAAGPWDISGAGSILKYNLTSGTWTTVTPSGFGGAFGGISVDPANADRLVASSINTYMSQDGSYGDRIFLSTNGGTTWTDLVARGFDLQANGSPWIEGNAIHWAGCVEFDPFDTKKAWVISGNGVFQTDDIDATTNVWKFQVDGLEETVPLDIVSIPNGPVLSAIGDYDGFRHVDVTQYAPIHTPRMGTTPGIAAASLNQNIAMRVGRHDVSGVAKGLIYYSSDMGVTWSERPASGLSGSLAISADGKIFLHAPEGVSKVYRSTDTGNTWTAVDGLSISSSRPAADPINTKKFYVYNSSNGSLLVSTDGGASFAASGSPGTGGSKIIRLAPYREGDVWVPLYNGGLTRSVNSGETFANVSGVTACAAVGFGKEAPGKSYPTVFIYGTVGGTLGVYRSIDEGLTWLRVNDDAHEYGGLANGQFVAGDMNVFGRVYMSTAGRGIVYGESSDTCLPTMVVPNIQVNAGSLQQTPIITVQNGSSVLLSPTPASGGTWSWQGPNDFTSTDREVTLSNIQFNQNGVYFVQYTNLSGCTSAWQTFTVNVDVKVQSITVTGEGNSTTIDQKDGTLQMIVSVLPENAANQSIKWSITSGASSGFISTTGLLTASGNGIVTVRATAKDGSNVFGELDITISNQTVTGIEDDLVARFEIYPNPVSTQLKIQNARPIKQVMLIGAQGQLLKDIKNIEPSMIINFDEIPSGLYILQLIDNKNMSYKKKIVKQ
jgi:xyloglucan-specific exo-beta-1,4-glucanase